MKELLQPPTPLKPDNDIWDQDYKSTSDEEDNDSSDEEEYGKVQYPKPRLNNSDPLHSNPDDAPRKEESDEDDKPPPKKPKP